MARTKAFEPDVALAKARDLFHKNGFVGTSMQELVDAMGINRASLYDTFVDKENLFTLCLTSFADLEEQGMRAAIGNYESGIEKLNALYLYLITPHPALNRQLGCFITQAALEREVMPEGICQTVTQLSYRTFQIVRGIVDLALERGELNGEAEQLTYYCLAFLMGLRNMQRAGMDQDPIVGSIKVFIDKLK